jgi:hypothetical protein
MKYRMRESTDLMEPVVAAACAVCRRRHCHSAATPGGGCGGSGKTWRPAAY